MAATKYNLTIEQGATFVKSITIRDGATGLVRDLTNYTARGMIRINIDDVTPIAQFSFNTLDATGVFTFQLTSVQTTAFAFEKGVYDIELVQKNTSPENVERILQGSVFLSKEVTR